MTAPAVPAAGPLPAARRPGLGAVRLMRLELRHNAMGWMLPVSAALFWITAYHKAMALPPLWNVRAASMQSGSVLAFIAPVVGAAAWMGSRDARRRTADLVTTTARPRWAGLLATWAATTCWAMAGYLCCLAVLYGSTAQVAHWGGPLWWPVAVVAASLPALSAIGFAAGTLIPSRFTAPLAAIAAFFVLVLSTELIVGSRSYWQVAPVITGPWDIGPDAGAGTLYPYLPDLAIAQVMFLSGLTIAVLAALVLARGSGGRWLRAGAGAVTAAGLLAAGTAVTLAGTSTLDPHGMIAIPALHDAASDRPIRVSLVCAQTAIPLCVNPAYARYLPALATAFEPVLTEIAGLPGAPARIVQAAASYRQESGNGVSVGLAGPLISGQPAVFHLLLSDQLLGPPVTADELAIQTRSAADPLILASVIGYGPGASKAQLAVMTALMADGRQPATASAARPAVTRRRPAARARRTAGVGSMPPPVAPGTPVYAAARRFAALPASARHAWLERHLIALRAGRDDPGPAAMTAVRRPARRGPLRRTPAGSGPGWCRAAASAWSGCTPSAGGYPRRWPSSRAAPSG